MVTGQAPVTLELRNTLGKNTNNPKWYTHISQLKQFMPPPETYKSEIGSQSTMCQVYVYLVHTSHYSRLEKPTIPLATQERLLIPRTPEYILHVVSITTHTHDRRKSIGKKRQRTNKRKERKEKRRKRKKENEKGKRKKYGLSAHDTTTNRPVGVDTMTHDAFSGM